LNLNGNNIHYYTSGIQNIKDFSGFSVKQKREFIPAILLWLLENTNFAVQFKIVHIMANKREIKKDVDYLIGEVISDCYTYLLIHGDKNREKVVEIIEAIIEKRNNFISRVNNPEKNLDTKQVKAHFKAINTDLLVAINDSFTSLSELSAKK
jgi:hypothetical protein